jgi:hypothetical protein
MQRISFLLLFFLGIAFQTSKGQKQSWSSPDNAPTAFVSLKTISKKAHFPMKFDNRDSLVQLQQYILKNNAQADTGRDEFHRLIYSLQEEVKKSSQSISSDKYNSTIKNYNNACQIIDYLSLQKIPSSFFEFSKEYYRKQICDPRKPLSLKAFRRTFTKHYKNYRLVRTGDKPNHGKDQPLVTTHNQLEKIMAEINPTFTSFSIKKQISLQRKVQIVNPWIESFKKGVTYNQTRETFFVDDEYLLLIPENQ